MQNILGQNNKLEEYIDKYTTSARSVNASFPKSFECANQTT